ncbi:unnamed protein product [Lactuca saligna]|uniref:Uncharacterized protein n=1 Tax=Lactuca saligna TaxID=75948 RepID=A0AA36E8Y0_LACSI|nr:unnamed protein product [Lactuca saligna]
MQIPNAPTDPAEEEDPSEDEEEDPSEDEDKAHIEEVVESGDEGILEDAHYELDNDGLVEDDEGLIDEETILTPSPSPTIIHTTITTRVPF